jgi:hypothetical protein
MVNGSLVLSVMKLLGDGNAHQATGTSGPLSNEIAAPKRNVTAKVFRAKMRRAVMTGELLELV